MAWWTRNPDNPIHARFQGPSPCNTCMMHQAMVQEVYNGFQGSSPCNNCKVHQSMAQEGPQPVCHKFSRSLTFFQGLPPYSTCKVCQSMAWERPLACLAPVSRILTMQHPNKFSRHSTGDPKTAWHMPSRTLTTQHLESVPRRGIGGQRPLPPPDHNPPRATRYWDCALMPPPCRIRAFF